MPRGRQVPFDPLGFGVDVRKTDFDVLTPERHQAPAHHIQAALANLRIVADDWDGIGWRYVPVGATFGVGRCGGIEKTILTRSRRRRGEDGRTCREHTPRLAGHPAGLGLLANRRSADACWTTFLRAVAAVRVVSPNTPFDP